MKLENQQYNILVDLVPALSGYAGIPQESRLLFKTLAQTQDQNKVGGLIYADNKNALNYSFGGEPTNKENIIMSANYLADLIDTSSSNNKTLGLLARLHKQWTRVKSMQKLLSTRSFVLNELYTEHFYGFLWRVLFAKSLLPEDFELLRQQRYYISDLNNQSMRLASYLKYNVTLDTRGWDFVIFQFLRHVNVSPGTTKIVRYHDSIALRDMDVAVPGGTAAQGTDLMLCADDTYYVCNSGPTRDELLAIVPELEQRTFVIPPILASYSKVLQRDHLLNIIRRGFSSLLCNEQQQHQVFAQLKTNKDFSYILMLATLEPRKNYLSLIRAWERIRATKQSDIKLIIVGNSGWKYADIAAAMKPHVSDGNIIHLEKILPEDMSYLYSHASAFVFPSYNEGFGIPPLEAMQCECPVIASDIKTHRWVYGDAALYCNPYDINSLVECLDRLLFTPDSKPLREALIRQGLERVKLYNATTIQAQWQDFFATIKNKKC